MYDHVFACFFTPYIFPSQWYFRSLSLGRGMLGPVSILWGRSCGIPLPAVTTMAIIKISYFRTHDHTWTVLLYDLRGGRIISDNIIYIFLQFSIFISTDLRHILYHEHIWIPLFYSQFFKLVNTLVHIISVANQIFLPTKTETTKRPLRRWKFRRTMTKSSSKNDPGTYTNQLPPRSLTKPLKNDGWKPTFLLGR